jgi:hypothetical protein
VATHTVCHESVTKVQPWWLAFGAEYIAELMCGNDQTRKWRIADIARRTAQWLQQAEQAGAQRSQHMCGDVEQTARLAHTRPTR